MFMESAAESRGKQFLRLRKKKSGHPLIAVGRFGFLPVSGVYIDGDAFMDRLILHREVVIIFIIRKEKL